MKSVATEGNPRAIHHHSPPVDFPPPSGVPWRQLCGRLCCAAGWTGLSRMSDPKDTQFPADPLAVGELITLAEAAEYAGLAYVTLHNYIKRGRLKAKKRGWMWFTTRAAIDEYLASRTTENIPKKYRHED